MVSLPNHNNVKKKTPMVRQAHHDKQEHRWFEKLTMTAGNNHDKCQTLFFVRCAVVFHFTAMCCTA
jgi:hypothetical protein